MGNTKKRVLVIIIMAVLVMIAGCWENKYEVVPTQKEAAIISSLEEKIITKVKSRMKQSKISNKYWIYSNNKIDVLLYKKQEKKYSIFLLDEKGSFLSNVTRNTVEKRYYGGYHRDEEIFILSRQKFVDIGYKKKKGGIIAINSGGFGKVDAVYIEKTDKFPSYAEMKIGNLREALRRL